MCSKIKRGCLAFFFFSFWSWIKMTCGFLDQEVRLSGASETFLLGQEKCLRITLYHFICCRGTTIIYPGSVLGINSVTCQDETSCNICWFKWDKLLTVRKYVYQLLSFFVDYNKIGHFTCSLVRLCVAFVIEDKHLLPRTLLIFAVQMIFFTKKVCQSYSTELWPKPRDKRHK